MMEIESRKRHVSTHPVRAFIGALLLVLLSSTAARAALTIEIIGAGAKQIPIAISQFLVMPHADARALARLKRLSPELYFRKAQKATAGFLVRRD